MFSTCSYVYQGLKMAFFKSPVQAASMHIPILVEAERLREGLDDLLIVADYAVCSAKFPKASTFS